MGKITKVITINDCYQCTKCRKTELGVLDYCTKSKRYIPVEELLNGIPSWCKLDDASTQEKSWKWSLEINHEQALVLKNALDFYSRIQMGQLEEVYHVAVMALNKYKSVSREDMDRAVRQLKKVLFPELMENSSHGIHSEKINDLARVAWDLQQVIRNRLAFDLHPPENDQLPWNVDYDTPQQSSSKVRLAKMKTIGKGKEKK